MCVHVPIRSPKTDEFPAVWFGAGKDVIFEGRTLRVPDEAEACLYQRYRDFMCLPPIEQRQPAHAKDGTQISATVDYRSFIPELYGNKT